LATFRDIERINAVRHQNSVFHAMLKHLPWTEFDRLVEEHGADEKQRGFTAKKQLIALLYGQLAGAASLRAIVEGLRSHERQLYHLGIAAVARSSLADANAHRSSALFAELLAVMIQHAGRGLRRAMNGVTYLLDATVLPLDGRSAGWAQFSPGVCGAKLHLVYDPDRDRPIYAVVSAANVNDITAAKGMPIERGATYVYDLAYYDYGWWAELDAGGCHFVTRLKRNTPITIIEARDVPPGGTILSDCVGLLPPRQAKSRKNPFGKRLREVQVKTDTGKVLRIATNDLEASAQQIADLYKRRWAIELFFRWVKQTLKLTKFLGTSENAVRTHIAVALIAFLLLRLAQATQCAVQSPLTFARLVRCNLTHRRDLRHLKTPPPILPANPNQLALL
jgi:hypothetical protein